MYYIEIITDGLNDVALQYMYERLTRRTEGLLVPCLGFLPIGWGHRKGLMMRGYP